MRWAYEQAELNGDKGALEARVLLGFVDEGGILAGHAPLGAAGHDDADARQGLAGDGRRLALGLGPCQRSTSITRGGQAQEEPL